MGVVFYYDIASCIELSLLDDLLIPLTLLTDSFLFCVLSFSGTGNRGTGEPGNRGTGEPGNRSWLPGLVFRFP